MLHDLFWRWRRRAGFVYRRWFRGVRDERTVFAPEDVESIRATFYGSGSGAGPEWTPFRHAHMTLPAWFRHGLDPWSPEYREQQLRLWSLVTGLDEPYDPFRHEKEAPWGDTDPVRRPGYYMRRDPGAVATASDHWLATGMLLKHCELKPGDHALEYGPGFGQSALALARLGVEVDTVDISETFCRFVAAQASFFEVPLRAHHGRFGWNPVPGRRYQLIWFYESFHHCLDFQAVVPALREMLAPGGQVILGGEPVMPEGHPAVPYPWGVRLHSEVAAVMRQTGWMELGFSEPFLFELFRRGGFEGRRIDCEPSLFGRLYVFRAAPTAG